MDKNIIKKVVPHIAAYFIFLAITFTFFAPYFTQGKSLNPADTLRARGMQGEMKKIYDETGEWPLWTNSMFGGMPVFQILAPGGGNFTKYIHKYSLLGQGILKPPYVCLWAMFMCYLMFWIMKVDWRIAIFCSFAFGLSTYYIDLAEAGHAAKMSTLAWVPGMILGALLIFRKKYLLGGALFALATSINIYNNHFQITFYACLILALLGLVELVYAIKEKEIPHFLKSSLIILFGLGLALMSNGSRFITTWEYSKETIRGKSELSAKAAKGDGLDKDYIWGWSYGKMESMTLLVPNFNGGGNAHTFKGSDFHDKYYPLIKSNIARQSPGMSQQALRKQTEKQIAHLFYWGDQPFVGTAIYFGAIICFLFFLGLVTVEGKMKWWLAIATFFSLSLAWGGNFFLNHILVDYFPMFNKFRAVSMALGLTSLTGVALCGLGLQAFLSKKLNPAQKQKSLLIAGGISLGLCLFAIIAGSMMQMDGANDGAVGPDMAAALKDARYDVLKADAFRSIFLILIAAGVLFAYLKGKIKAIVAVLLIGIFSTVDIWMVNKRIIFKDKYEVPSNETIEPQKIDKQLMAESDPHFRVLDLRSGDPFTDYRTSFFHKSLGGYHAAKLMRFQDVRERYLQKPSENRHIVGMLNGKYFIQGAGDQGRAIPNDKALGNAWFVREYSVVENGDEEMDGLANLDPANKVLVQKAHAGALEGFNVSYDSTASIKLTKYHPDRMTYSYSASSDQIAVFSEIYYPPSKGWNTYLDGEPFDPFFKANFLLRAMKLPAGKDRVLEMRFEPKSFYLGETISKVSSLLILLGFFAALWFYFKQNNIPESSLLDDEEEVTRKVEEPLKEKERPKNKVVKRKASNKDKKKKK